MIWMNGKKLSPLRWNLAGMNRSRHITESIISEKISRIQSVRYMEFNREQEDFLLVKGWFDEK